MLLTRRLFFILTALLTGCTVVPPAADVITDVATPDATVSVDVEVPDVGSDALPDAEPDVTVGPADVPVGPTDVFIPRDTASDVASDVAADVAEVDAGPTLPFWDTPRMKRWRLVWEDDFDGPPCDPNDLDSCRTQSDRDRASACFGSRSNPVNTRILRTFHADPANTTHSDERYVAGLVALDKCVWSVSEHVNSRHFLGSAGAIMAYSPSAVTIERGELRLTTRRVGGNTDCGRKLDAQRPTSEENMSRSCEYQGANVVTQPFRGLEGAAHTAAQLSGNGRVFPPSGKDGGRLEVRLKTPRSRGDLPIISTWPAIAGLGTPEYTLFQHMVDQPRVSRHVATTYGGSSAASTTATHTWDETQPTALYDEFHTVAVDWEANKYAQFDINGRRLSRVASGAAIGSAGQCLALHATSDPVHLVIRHIIAQYENAPGSGPEGAGQMPDMLRIDWVRWWEPCEDDDLDPACVESTINPACKNPCGGLGAYEDGLCFLGEAPMETTPAISEHYIGYHPGTGLNPCTRGGTKLENICALVALPAGRIGSARGSRLYSAPACEPTAALVNCGQPCPVEGTYWVAARQACFYREGIAGTNSFVYANTLYYGKIEGNPDGFCPFGGNFDGANCSVGRPPAGHQARTFGNDYYLFPFACPDGGTWNTDIKACHLKEFPAGTNPFVYAGSIYYPTATAGVCAHGGTWDGANCRLRDIPVGARAFTNGNNAYFRAECSDATNWSALQTYPGSSSVSGLPCP